MFNFFHSGLLWIIQFRIQTWCSFGFNFKIWGSETAAELVLINILRDSFLLEKFPFLKGSPLKRITAYSSSLTLNAYLFNVLFVYAIVPRNYLF